MKKIELKSVWFKAFRSFKEPHLLNFPSHGLVAIKGASGSGKSTLHSSISYGLGYCPYYETEIQSWLTKEKPQVEIVLESKDEHIVVKRGFETFFKLNDKYVQGKSSLNGEIEKLFGMPLELLDALTFRQQRKRGRFFSMTDKEKKEFLSKLLNLDELEIKIDDSTKKVNLLSSEISKLETIIETSKANLRAPIVPREEDLSGIETDIKNLHNDIDNLTKELVVVIDAIKQLKLNIEQIDSQIFLDTKTSSDPEIVKIQLEINDLQHEIDKENLKWSKHLDELREHRFFIINQINLIYHNDNEIASLTKDLKILNDKIKSLYENKCFTCKQSWQNNDLINEYTLQANETNQQINILNTNATSLDQLNDELHKLDDQTNTPSPTLAILNEQYWLKQKTLNTALANIRADNLQRLSDFNKEKDKQKEIVYRELEPLQNRTYDLSGKIEHLKYKIKEWQLVFNMSKKHYKDLQYQYESEKILYLKAETEIKHYVDKLNQTKQTFNEEIDFIGLCKGFLAKIFDDVLSEIALETNELLKRVPNTSNVTLNFTSETVTQKETIKQEIKPVIYKNGNLASIRSGLSDGQFSSLELATDLAIGKIIGARTGVMPNWIILDEPFDGLDPKSKECYLELLREVASDRLILVIDHSVETSDLFDMSFNVSIENDESSLKVN